MSNTFLALPTIAANGPGDPIDVSELAGTKTIVVKGNGTLFEPYVLIEFSNDDGPTNWTPLVQFVKPGTMTVECAARYMRAVVKNYSQGGAPTVSLGAADDTVQFAQLVAPEGNGVGAAVDISSMPGFKTIQVTGAFKGVANIEVSCDQGESYATIASLTTGGGKWSGVVYGDRMRISRSGIQPREPRPGTLTVDVASVALSPGGGGGGGGAEVYYYSLGSSEIIEEEGQRILVTDELTIPAGKRIVLQAVVNLSGTVTLESTFTLYPVVRIVPVGKFLAEIAQSTQSALKAELNESPNFCIAAQGSMLSDGEPVAFALDIYGLDTTTGSWESLGETFGAARTSLVIHVVDDQQTEGEE